MQTTDAATPQDPRVIAERIAAAADAIGKFARAFVDVDPLDTSSVERERLARAHALVAEALDLFS